MKTHAKAKWLILGAIITIVISALTATAIAAQRQVQATLTYRDITVTMDGRQLPLSAEPFILDGTTYLPLRAIGEALGLTASWDGTANTVSLTTGGGAGGAAQAQPQSQYLMDIAPAYEAHKARYGEYSTLNDHRGAYPPSDIDKIPERDKTSFRMGGVTYQNGVRFGGRVFVGWARYNLNGEYSRLTGIIGAVVLVSNSGNHDGVLEVYHEGVFKEEIPVSNGMIPREISINVSGVNHLELRLKINMYNPTDFAIANPVLTK